MRLIAAQTEDYLLGRSDDGKTHHAADTARYAVELLEASRIFNAGICARFQRDGDIRRTAAIMSRSDEGMPVSGSIEVVPGVVNPITIAYAHSRKLSANRGMRRPPLAIRIFPEKRAWNIYWSTKFRSLA